MLTVLKLMHQVAFLLFHDIGELLHSLLLLLTLLHQSDIFVLERLDLDGNLTAVLEDALELTRLLDRTVLVQN